MTSKTLICYGTRYGSTAEVAQKMADIIVESGSAVDLVDLKTSKPPMHVQEYDLVIIGSGIQVGKWTKHPLQFIEKNLETLSASRVALFVVCGSAAHEDQCDDAQRDFLDKIVEDFPGLSPVSTGLFAGLYDFKRYSFPVRVLVKRIVKSELPPGEEVPEKIDYRDWDAIREWVLGLIQ